MALSTCTCTLQLRTVAGAALAGADVFYRVAPVLGDADGDTDLESAIYARRAKVQTAGTGIATIVVPAPCTLYVSAPDVRIPECRIEVSATDTTLELGPLIAAQLPTLDY